MTAQNLVSGALTEEQKAAVTGAIQTIKEGIPTLVVLQPQEKKEFVRVGNTYIPFIDLAHQVMVEHPEVMPGIFDTAEFNRDYQLAIDLLPILGQLNELAESVEDTIFAARSDVMSGALEVYAAVQQNKDKIPGMDTVAAQMASFFKRAGRRAPAEQEAK